MTSLARRVALVSTRIAPAPDSGFPAYARAVIAWGGGPPDDAAAVRFTRDLAGTRGGATWEGVVELAGEPGGRTACYRPPPEHTTDTGIDRD